MDVTGLKLRWINTQCYQIQLPNGAVILTDPTIRKPRADRPQYDKMRLENFGIEDLGRVDYIIVSHTHFDHIPDVGRVFELYHPLVIVHQGCAKELGEYFNIPFTYIYPVGYEDEYVLVDFTLTTLHGRHNARVTRRLLQCGDAGRDIYDDMEGDTTLLGGLGDLYNLNFTITTKENYRIGYGAGMDDAHLLKKWEDAGLNILLRFITGLSKGADFNKILPEAVKWIEHTKAQLMLPMHHESLYHDDPASVAAFVEKTNTVLQEKGINGRMFDPKRCKWIHIGMFAQVE